VASTADYMAIVAIKPELFELFENVTKIWFFKIELQLKFILDI